MEIPTSMIDYPETSKPMGHHPGLTTKSGSSAAREVAWQYFKHSSGKRTNTTAVLAATLKRQYPNLHLSIVPVRSVNILNYACKGHASFVEAEDDTGEGGAPASIWHKLFVPPAKRDLRGTGTVLRAPTFCKFLYRHQGHDLIVYLSRTQDGAAGIEDMYYILSAEDAWANALIHAAGAWQSQLHDEISVFEEGAWHRDTALYARIMEAKWNSIIMEEVLKKELMEDHVAFFNSGSTYKNFGVSWKRGIILHGPPGNGKTMSIKAMVKTLHDSTPEVPTLWVRSLASPVGLEQSIKRIFDYARREAPCCLVFEDLDSLDSDRARSCFLKEADSLESDSGIFMIGVTNHLDRLDPDIINRPSRFDRKYYFPNPNHHQRLTYCESWQSKLASNESIDFPVQLCDTIAEITDGFSFAYIQEAFVGALMAIMWQTARDEDLVERLVEHLSDHLDAKSDVRSDDHPDGEGYDTDSPALVDECISVEEPVSPDKVDLEQLKLWVEIKKQIQILGKEIKKQVQTLGKEIKKDSEE